MSKRGRNDRHDTEPIEGKLIRIGHYLWKLYRQAVRAREGLSRRCARNSLASEVRVPRRVERSAEGDGGSSCCSPTETDHSKSRVDWLTVHKVIAKQRRKRNTTR